jgi:hypothetical protein
MTALILGVVMLCGCSSIQMERGAKGSAEYEKITIRAPPKDWSGLDFKWGETRLKAGDAVTAEQPWAEVVGGISKDLMLNMMAYCRAHPAMCEGK